MRKSAALLLSIATLTSVAGAQSTAPVSGKRAASLVIRNATIIDGAGTPSRGPADIVVRGNRIESIVYLDPVAVAGGRARRPAGDTEIDATGKYVLPGLINAHAHVQDERGGIAQPLDYELKIWLACGITTIREVGADNTQKIIELRERSEKGEVASPRIYVYARFSNPPVPKSVEAARLRVRELKAMGADGIKLVGTDRDIMTNATAAQAKSNA
ncbi:MAG: amidohydrolase, partial [Gemmatimonadales bacterium]